MGTVADKLQRLAETKEAIRQAVIGKGQDVPDNLPFSGYPEKIASIPSGGGPYEVTIINGGLKAARPLPITVEVFFASEDGSTIDYFASSPQTGFTEVTLRTTGLVAVWVDNAAVNVIETDFGYDDEMADGCIGFSINGNGTITLSS